MANKDQSFEIRSKDNTSEEYFESYCKHRKYKIIRYGLDQRESNITGREMITIPRMIRNTPDYILINEKRSYFVEVKGCNKYLGLKLKDIESYKKWNKIMPLCYFFYSLHHNQHKVVEHKNLMDLTTISEIRQYPDHNEYDDKLYYSIHWSTIYER